MKQFRETDEFSLDDILSEIKAKEATGEPARKQADQAFQLELSFTEEAEQEIPAKPMDDFARHDAAKTRRVDGIEEHTSTAEAPNEPLPLDGSVEDYLSEDVKRQEKELLDRQAFLNLKENRKKKIKDFVLVGEEEDNDPDEEDEEPEDDLFPDEIDDLESPEDIPVVAQDIKELKGSLTLRLIILLVATGLSLGLFAINAWLPGITPDFLSMKEEPLLFASANMLLLLFGAAFSYTTITGGIMSIVRLRPERDSLPALAAVVCVIQNAVCMFDPASLADPNVHLYTPLALLGLLFNVIGKLIIVSRTGINFKMVSSDYNKYGCHLVEDEGDAAAFTRGLLQDAPVLAVNQKTGFLRDFMLYSYGEDLSDRVSRLLAPISLIGALLLAGVVQFMMDDIHAAIGAFVATICLCAPIGLMFTVHLPLRWAAKKLSRHGAAILGYKAAEDYAELNSAVVSAKDLFPQGSVTLYGIKTFGEQRIDEAILDAASVACEAQSILSDVFLQVIAGKTEMLREAESLLYEDSMGVSAWVGNKRVLIGNRELMLNHGVDVPSRDYEVRYLDEGKELIYLSSGGELSGVFVVGLSADPQIRAALKKQEMNDIFLTVKCVDPILNHDKLGEIFDVEPAMFKIMPARLQEVYQRETRPEDWISSPVANNGSFYSYVSALVCAKRLKGAAMIGMVLQLASIVAGYALLSVFGVLGDFSQLTTLSLAAYQGIWFVLSVIGSRMRNL